MNRLLLSTLSVAVLGAVAGSVLAANPNVNSAQDQVSDQDIYGYQLMTPEERNAHRSQMQSAKTSADRDRMRTEHQAAMQNRAKERGITLPDNSPASRGPGSGMGGDGTR